MPSIDWYLVLVRGGLALLTLGPSLLLAMFLLTRGDLELVRAALRLLLSVEDDRETITELKTLIARLPPAVA